MFNSVQKCVGRGTNSDIHCFVNKLIDWLYNNRNRKHSNCGRKPVLHSSTKVQIRRQLMDHVIGRVHHPVDDVARDHDTGKRLPHERVHRNQKQFCLLHVRVNVSVLLGAMALSDRLIHRIRRDVQKGKAIRQQDAVAPDEKPKAFPTLVRISEKAQRRFSEPIQTSRRAQSLSARFRARTLASGLVHLHHVQARATRPGQALRTFC
mmetsp:Transcript_9015/g.23637  ORF Transcript_9015/g.23637 Transcript_9015/m.23637 type:complete len:207 (-) Transcript_9015:149-769(-)